ncbi:MAG: apolipoprotein N-acyltransferase [Candidatus Pelagibacterales bacterium]|nr:MAG: apolipoprotein N-acyltransferase [Pelagibacterales bacterium]
MFFLTNNKFFVIFFIPFLLGAITVLSFSPYNLTIVNFFTFSILLFLILEVKKKTQSIFIKKKSKRYFFYLGCSYGFGFFLLGNYWISISLTHDEMFTGLIPFALILIPLFLSLFFGFTILAIGVFAKKNISFILLFSSVFSFFEFLRGNLLTGFPWNLISYTWSWSLEISQILSLIGSYSLSLLSITLFCTPFLFFQKKIVLKNIIFISSFLLIFVTIYSYGVFRINNSAYKFDKKINIKIISPNFSLKDYATYSEEFQIKRLIKISNPEKDKKTLFIWPEGIFYQSYLDDIKKYQNLFKDRFSENHLIILGINNFNNNIEVDSKKYFNSLVVLNHELDVLSLYNKINLVPFGEFLPFERILSKFGFKKITPGYSSFSPGDKREMINLGNNFNEKLILPLICYEIIYPANIKKKEQHPDLVVNISEDAWFGKSIGPYQHFTKAIYRSIEEGVFVARSANKGISALIDPNGKVLKSLNTGEAGNIEYKFPYFSKSTLFSKYGNKIFYLIIILYMFLILIFRKFKFNE